ncbi:hypothetical protein DPMN_091405 [Dreissena polymorpha]|uniref:Uncharacterized protein n=1 Tax=Dreissena polymorpha TaxID=45954 RepID=A0A9D4KZH0_DREPO|nr:hypothetical protein DPMN_091405 [Dreissena polymorpha]
MCDFMEAFCVKHLLHILHWNGLSPVWTLTCISREAFDGNCLPQNEQAFLSEIQLRQG